MRAVPPSRSKPTSRASPCRSIARFRLGSLERARNNAVKMVPEPDKGHGRGDAKARAESSPDGLETVGGDPRRSDSGLGGRLVDTFARQLGGQVARESGNTGTIVCLTLPSREASLRA